MRTQPRNKKIEAVIGDSKNNDELKTRLNVIRGLMASGNDSPELIEEMSQLLTKLKG